MIIVEGLDGTGKTTLVSRLMGEFPDLHHRPSIGNKHDPIEIQNQAEAEAFQYGANVISDRSRIISEYIYTPILKARDPEYRDPAYPVQNWLKYIGSWVDRPQCLVYCTRSFDALDQSLAESDREQLAGVRERLGDLEIGYTRIIDFIDWLFRQSPRGHEMVIYNFDMAGEDYDPFYDVKDTVGKYLTAQGVIEL